jgi:hypothetical protein
LHCSCQFISLSCWQKNLSFPHFQDNLDRGSPLIPYALFNLTNTKQTNSVSICNDEEAEFVASLAKFIEVSIQVQN